MNGGGGSGDGLKMVSGKLDVELVLSGKAEVSSGGLLAVLVVVVSLCVKTCTAMLVLDSLLLLESQVSVSVKGIRGRFRLRLTTASTICSTTTSLESGSGLRFLVVFLAVGRMALRFMLALLADFIGAWFSRVRF